MRVSKQPGEKWLVMMANGGGQLDIEAKDDAVYDSVEGLLIYHNDKNRTVTCAPVNNIAWVRSYEQTAGSQFRGAYQGVLPPVSSLKPLPPIDLGIHTRELTIEEVTAQYDTEWTCPDCGHPKNWHQSSILNDGTLVCNGKDDVEENGLCPCTRLED